MKRRPFSFPHFLDPPRPAFFFRLVLVRLIQLLPQLLDQVNFTFGIFQFNRESESHRFVSRRLLPWQIKEVR